MIDADFHWDGLPAPVVPPPTPEVDPDDAERIVAKILAGMAGEAQDDTPRSPLLTAGEDEPAETESMVDDDPDLDPNPLLVPDEVDVAQQKPALVTALAGLVPAIPSPDPADDMVAHARALVGTPYSQCKDGSCGAGDRFGLDLGDRVVRADCTGLLVGAATLAGVWIDPAAWWTVGMLEDDRLASVEVPREAVQHGDWAVNAAHAGILTAEETVVHASGSRGVVEEPVAGSWFEEQDDLRFFRVADLVAADEEREMSVDPFDALTYLILDAEVGSVPIPEDAYFGWGSAPYDAAAAVAFEAVGMEDDMRLSQMSVGAVLDWQDQYVAAQRAAGLEVVSSAVGWMQALGTTLADAVHRGVVAEGDLWRGDTQDAVALDLLKKRGWDDWIAGDITDEEFLLRLSQEWAGLPDPTTGRSHYDGVAGNRAHVTVYEALASLAEADR